MKFFQYILVFLILQSLDAQTKESQEYKGDAISFLYPTSWEIGVNFIQEKQENGKKEKQTAPSLINSQAFQEILLLPDRREENNEVKNISQKDLDKIKSLENKNTAIIISLKRYPEIYWKILGRKNAIQNSVSFFTASLYEDVKKSLISKGVLSEKKNIQRKKVHRPKDKNPTSANTGQEGKIQNPLFQGNNDPSNPETAQKWQEEWKKYQEQEKELEKKMSPEELKIYKERIEYIKKLTEALKIQKSQPVNFAGEQGWMLEFTLQLSHEKPSYRHVYMNILGNYLVTILVFFTEAEPQKEVQMILNSLKERK
ncbi:MAG: hypothetical protein HUU50_16700 [Candidatus Brocadiae bacterium]|nr:hypothetical protein [Candidatus Brocadiia bacterium]